MIVAPTLSNACGYCITLFSPVHLFFLSNLLFIYNLQLYSFELLLKKKFFHFTFRFFFITVEENLINSLLSDLWRCIKIGYSIYQHFLVVNYRNFTLMVEFHVSFGIDTLRLLLTNVLKYQQLYTPYRNGRRQRARGTQL